MFKQEKEIVNAQFIETQQKFKSEVEERDRVIRSKQEDNDSKVRQALEEAIKQHNIESVAAQYAKELDVKKQEIEAERNRNKGLQEKIAKLEDEHMTLNQGINLLRQLLSEKEIHSVRANQQHRDQLSRLQQLVRVQLSKQRADV